MMAAFLDSQVTNRDAKRKSDEMRVNDRITIVYRGCGSIFETRDKLVRAAALLDWKLE